MSNVAFWHIPDEPHAPASVWNPGRSSRETVLWVLTLIELFAQARQDLLGIEGEKACLVRAWGVKDEMTES